MRVLMLTSSYPKWPGDGTAPVIERIAREVARRGHEVDLVLPRHPDLVLEGRSGGLPIRFFPFFAGPPRFYAWGYASSLKADRQLRAQALASAPLALLSGARTVRRLLASSPYDVVHAHWVLPNGTVAALGMLGRHIPLAVSLHGSDVFLAERSRSLAAVARWTFARSEWVMACAGDLAERAERLGASRARTEVLLHGVDLDAFRSGDPRPWREKAGLGEGEVLVVALGRLVEKKGFAFLIEAAARLRRQGVPVRVVIGGAGDLESDLAARVRALDTDAVRLLGDVPHDQVGGLFQAADVVAVPSVRDARGNVDGLPNVLLEAMAAGRPIVATRIAGNPDVIRDGENGLLVPPEEAVPLAEAIGRLAGDHELARRLGGEARRSAERLSWPAFGERLVAGYERLVAERRAH